MTVSLDCCRLYVLSLAHDLVSASGPADTSPRFDPKPRSGDFSLDEAIELGG